MFQIFQLFQVFQTFSIFHTFTILRQYFQHFIMLGLLVSAASPPNYPGSTSSHSQAPVETLYRFDYVEQILKFQNEFGQKLHGHPAGRGNVAGTWYS